MDFQAILPYLAVIAALALLWPRGYLLIYLIDRSKSFRFGFKFLVGWIFGASGFTIDLFAAHVVGHQPFTWWIILASAISQIIGFGFIIFLFERRLVLPRFSHLIPFLKILTRRLWHWSIFEKLVLGLVLVVISIGSLATYRAVADQQYADIPALVIYENDGIPTDSGTIPLPGGIQSYPLNDTLLKVYISRVVGAFSSEYLGIVNLFYLFILCAAFYFMLPIQLPRLLRLGATLALVLSEAIAWWGGGVYSADLLYSFFLLLTVASLFYYLAGAGLSFFYLSLMALSFAIWSHGAALLFVFPAILLATVIVALTHRVAWRHVALSWFFAALTLVPWLLVNQNLSRTFLLIPSLYEELLTSRGWGLFAQAFTAHGIGMLWFIMFAFILLWYKKIWRQYPLLFLTVLVLVLRITSAPQALISTPEIFSRLVFQMNAWFVPLVLFTVTFYFHDLFGRLHWYGKKI